MIYFISDLHLGHKNILKFSPERHGSTIEEHDDWIIEICSGLTKRNILYILGDISWTREGLARLEEIKAQKNFILGNHDGFRVEEYMKYGRVLPGLYKYKGFWLSHAPVHPVELRGCKNIHGHVHSNTLPDERYINVSVENFRRPISLEELRT